MSKKISLRSPQGCLLLLLQIIGIVANIKDVVEFIGDLNNNIVKPFIVQDVDMTGDLFFSGVLLFYGVSAIALSAWWAVAYKALGIFQSMFSAFVLHFLGSALFIISFFYKFSIAPTIMSLFIGAFLFLALPLVVGYVVLTLMSSPNN